MKLYIYIETNSDYSPFPQNTIAFTNERTAMKTLKDAFVKEATGSGYSEILVRDCINGKFSFEDCEAPQFNETYASVDCWSACVEEAEINEDAPASPSLKDYADGDNLESLYTILTAWREFVGGEAEMWFCDTKNENDLKCLIDNYGPLVALEYAKKGRFLVCGMNYEFPEVANLYSYLEEACDTIEEHLCFNYLTKEYLNELLEKKNGLGTCIDFAGFIKDANVQLNYLKENEKSEEKPEPEAGPDGNSKEIYIVDYFNNELNATQERVFTCLAEAKEYEAKLVEGVKTSVEEANGTRILNDLAVIEGHSLPNGRTTYFYNLHDWDKNNEWGFISFKVIKL